MILPLAWVIERACNGVWHVGWAIHFREYSPGLSLEHPDVDGISISCFATVPRMKPSPSGIWIQALMIGGAFAGVSDAVLPGSEGEADAELPGHPDSQP